MSKGLILVCDDESRIEESLSERINRIGVVKDNFNVEFSKGRLAPAIEALENRLKNVRQGSVDSYPDDEAGIIDNTSILVIDYDLIEMDASITGERASYLARCYSKCGFIVALNQFPPYVNEYFDLTLKGHPESFADLNIPSDSLSNPGLWEEPWDGFRPWRWPLLPSISEKFERRVPSILEHLDHPILEYFGFLGGKSINLSRSLIEYISRSEDHLRTSFRDFVLNSGEGLRRKDEPLSDEAIARIASARLANWFENLLLPGQDILVDAPHLISRYPSLIDGDITDIKVMNRAVTFNSPDQLGLDPILEKFRFEFEDWVSRPVWFWNDVSNCDEIKEVSDPWSAKRSDFVFCEDISRFAPLADTKEFVADLQSPFVRRYIKYVDGKEYIPQVRFSM